MFDPAFNPSYPYIAGNSFKNLARHILDENGKSVNDKGISNVHFVKTDHVHKFFSRPPSEDFVLITHNSDFHISEQHAHYLDTPNLKIWYAQNVDLVHPKLRSIPIGIANTRWPHGNPQLIKEIESAPIEKSNRLYVNFDINTNKKTRTQCIEQTGLQPSPRKDFKEYLAEMKSSFFVLSPDGNGVDCHKTWEALYLGAIPIVTESININFYKHLPILVLKDWTELKNIGLSEELYKKLWGDFYVRNLYFENYVSTLSLT